ncbi:nucleotidyltransferase family protein [uncultured Paraglaciecola sp.]|uniref:nucleotidyltransferase domain-containing protein n=1 Tax=uncultured Paraglaciecola sp. TaxID=1765024 RepID=UPI0026332F97|nr:nucleotidyltransferase family protein [uncultured Paraglaciecola sp.]
MKNIEFKQLVSLLCNADLGINYSETEWSECILILREAKLLGRLYYQAVNQGCYKKYPEFVQRHLYSASVHAKRQAHQVVFEAELITRTLAKIGVTPTFLKGASYTLRNSGNSLGRICSDIDLLVAKEELEKVEAHLKTKLWRSEELSEYDDKYYREWAHEIPPMFHPIRNTVLDIHHNLYLPISGRSPNISLFLQHVSYVGSGVRVLNEPVTVLHSIIHLFMNEDFTNAFRDLLDIHLLIEQYENPEFWKKLCYVSDSSGFGRELYYCLSLRGSIFLYPQPECFEALQSKYKNWRTDFFIKHVLSHAITPKHSLLDNYQTKNGRFLVFLRGHYLKMPLSVLIKHLTIKSLTGMVDSLFGKHFLEKS